MAANKNKVSDLNLHWTNERHVHFLNSMEASFIRSMFDNNRNFPRLDRYLPDTLESTEDLGKKRRRYSASDIVESRGRKMEKRIRNSSHISSQDQVVPQCQSRKSDEDKDEKDHDLDISLGTTN